MRATLVALVIGPIAAAAAGCVEPAELAPGPAASLGRPCSQGSECPAGHRCVQVAGVGSQTEGFCTIPCVSGDTATCAAGFGGPGRPRCALTMPPPDHVGCVVLCDTPGGTAECPDGLSCTFAPLQGENVCVQPG